MELLHEWKPTVAGNTTFIILFVFGVKHDRELDALNPFNKLADRENAQRKDFFITNVFAGSAGAADEDET